MFAPSKDHCMVANCDRPREVRGICASCYRSASRKVRLNETTWDELEKLGIVLASKHGTTKGALTTALNEARELAAK
jgi:thymidine kinase